MKRLALVVAVCVLIGCSQSRVISKTEPLETPKPLTQKIRSIADSHQRVQGTPLILTSDQVDRYVTDVTKRPVQQELFSRYLMTYLLQKKDGGREVPVIHLGDVLDGSCKYEWLKIKDIIGAKRDFALVPGNHDGFMQGNFYSVNDPLKGWWAALCDEGRFQNNQHMRNPEGAATDCEPCANRLVNTIATKPFMINEYLALLAQNRYPSLAKNLPGAGRTESGQNEWQSEDPDDFLQKVAWKSCEYPLDFDGFCNGYNSYLLQLVKLPPADRVGPTVFLLLLDTAQYEKPLKLGVTVLDEHLAGVRGEIHEEQRRKAREWVDQMIQAKKGFVLLAGHHPFASLSEGSRAFVAELADRTGIRFYMSAHTHVGGWEYHSDYRLTELNVGSINDWPIHYRDFSVELQADKLLVKSNYMPIGLETTHELTGKGCRPEWFVDETSKLSVKNQERDRTSDYRKAQRDKTGFTLLQYRELLKHFSGGDVARVFYVPATDIDCSRSLLPARFVTAEDLSTAVDKTVAGMSEIEGYRDAARLGLLCREVLISVSQAVFDPNRHKSTDGKSPSETDAKRMLEAVLEMELSGSSNEEARAYARAALRLALALQHKRTADFRTAALCAEATFSVVNISAVLGTRRKVNV